ncbi:hypothetical protein E2P81_ATG03701 [Venturia nashicola]|nr:hypothetical protein E2P81_ATG03701 [Venturia nashicola]
MAWVQQNIFKFGGDARKVTVFGESAGARSADFHLLTMRENPPFRAVIMQSGSAELTPLADMNKAAESAKKGTAFQQLARAFTCPADDGKVALECLRAIPATAIKQKMKELALYSGSVEDGGLATVQDQATIRQTHQAANVPLLLGTNADEMRGSLRSYNTSSLSSYLNSTFPTHQSLIPKLLNAYTPSPSTPYKTPFDAMAALATDLSFTCITSREAHISTTSSYPTYRYLFTASYPNTQKFPGSGANHAHEIQFIFGNLPKDSTNEESDLSTLMQNTWARFAKNPDAGPGWVRYGITAGGKDMGRFDSDGGLRIVSSGGVDRNCHLFEEMYAGRA